MASKLQMPMQAQAFLDLKSGWVQPSWYLFLTKLLASIVNMSEYTQVTPAPGATVTMPTSGSLILTPAGTLAALTITLPTAIDGQVVSISTTQAITALTLTPVAGSVIGPTSLSALQAFHLVWMAPIAKWVIAP